MSISKNTRLKKINRKQRQEYQELEMRYKRLEERFIRIGGPSNYKEAYYKLLKQYKEQESNIESIKNILRGEIAGEIKTYRDGKFIRKKVKGRYVNRKKHAQEILNTIENK